MYAVAGRLDPDSYLALATVTFREMVAAGITCVGEFHYLHHQPDGTPYDDPNAMGHALLEAARTAGLRITLLDTCYLTAGIGRPVEGVQRRFSDGDVDGWSARVDALVTTDGARIGAAYHSVRAVPRDQMRAPDPSPLHIHLSEQVAENEQCVAAYGLTPTQVFAEAGHLTDRNTLVHATHLIDDDVRLIGEAQAYVDFCPTTERDLGDGIGPRRALRDAGARLTLGSDSHAVIDLFEEMRAVELDERLATRQRGHWTAADLLVAGPVTTPSAGTTPVGSRSAVGPTWSRSAPIGSAPPAPVPTSTRSSSPRSPRTSSTSSSTAGSSSGRMTARSSAATWPPRSTGSGSSHERHRHHRHRRARHQRPRGPDALGTISDAALVVEGSTVAWVGPAAEAPAADEQVDAGGRAVLPGFVDSHSHLVFAGDRAAEFAARMAGESVRRRRHPRHRGRHPGGDRRPAAATSDGWSGRCAGRAPRPWRSRAATGSPSTTRPARLAVARQFAEETTFLGAHVVPDGTTPEEYVALVTGPMLEACAPHARWVDAFCERGAFDADQARSRARGRGRGWDSAAVSTRTSSAPDPAYGSRRSSA